MKMRSPIGRLQGFYACTLCRWMIFLTYRFALKCFLPAVFTDGSFFHAVCQDKSLAEGLGFLVIDFFFSFESTFWPFLILNASCFVLPYSPHCHLSIHEGCLHCCVHLAHLLWPQSMTGKKSIRLCLWEKKITIKACVKNNLKNAKRWFAKCNDWNALCQQSPSLLSASRVLHSSGSCSWLKSCLWVGAYGCCCLLHRQAFGSKGELFQSCRWLMRGAAIKITTRW